MTREEILNTPEIVDFMIDKSVMVDSKMKLHKRLEELCKLAIEALEQQPCEDAISRADVKKYLSAPDANGDRVIYESDLDLLPSVTPHPKNGHWIEKDGLDGDIYYDCSECCESFCLIDGTPTDNLYNYCPNCGAKMTESEGEEWQKKRLK